MELQRGQRAKPIVWALLLTFRIAFPLTFFAARKGWGEPPGDRIQSRTQSTQRDAERSELRARARSHWDVGSGYYRLGNYRDALREFTAAYALAPLPALLIDLGQSYRKLGQLEQARSMYVKYLGEAPPGRPERDQVRKLVVLIDEELAKRPPVATAVTLPRSLSSLPPPAPGNAALQLDAPPVTAKPQPSFARRHWWIFPVGGAALVGLAVGIYYAARPPNACGSWGCLQP